MQVNSLKAATNGIKLKANKLQTARSSAKVGRERYCRGGIQDASGECPLQAKGETADGSESLGSHDSSTAALWPILPRLPLS